MQNLQLNLMKLVLQKECRKMWTQYLYDIFPRTMPSLMMRVGKGLVIDTNQNAYSTFPEDSAHLFSDNATENERLTDQFSSEIQIISICYRDVDRNHTFSAEL